jgi:hypothetical protein
MEEIVGITDDRHSNDNFLASPPFVSLRMKFNGSFMPNFFDTAIAFPVYSFATRFSSTRADLFYFPEYNLLA